MLRTILFTFVLLLPATAPCAQPIKEAQDVQQADETRTIREVDVGGATVRIEVPEGYVSVAARSPELLEAMGKTIPNINLLLETLLAKRDYTRVVIGLPAGEMYYQVQVSQTMAEIPVSPREWTEYRPTLIRELGGLRTDRLMAEASEHLTKAVEENTGEDARVRIGGAQTKPIVYGDDPRSVRFWMVMPLEVKVGDEVRRRRIVTAAATTQVSGRLIFLYAFRTIGEDEQADPAEVRAALEAFVARVYALNP